MEALMAEPWYWILGTLFFALIVMPILSVWCLAKFFCWIRDWWHKDI